MLLVSLSFISMFKQTKASGDRAGGQGRWCRCSWNCTSHCSPRNVHHRKPSIQNTGWVSLVGVHCADSSLKPKTTVNAGVDQTWQWQLCHRSEDLFLMLGFSADAAKRGTCVPWTWGAVPRPVVKGREIEI